MIKRIFSLTAFLLTAAFATAQQPELYKDWHQTPEARADDIIRRLTIEEKARLMIDVSEPVERLGIPKFQW